MSIKSDVQELEGIKKELRKLGARMKQLRDRAKQIEASISDFLKSKDQPGLKHNGIAFIVEEKEIQSYKKQKDKDASAIEVLKELGVESPEKALTKILEARKGDIVVKEKLKIKKIKN